MSGRDANQLAADVRRAIDTLTDASFGEAGEDAMHEDSLNAYAALDALVARITDLEERYDVLASTVKGTAFDVVAEKVDAEIKLARAEARITDLAAQVEDWKGKAEFAGMPAWIRLWEEKEAAEAQVAALTQERDEYQKLCDDNFDEGLDYKYRAEAAEAALAEAQQQIKDQDRRIRCQRTALAGLNRMTEGDSHYAGRKRAEAALATTRQALTEITQVPYQSGRARGDVAVAIARRALAASAEAAEATGRGT